MKQMWTPWRMDFIAKPKKGGCVFCGAQKSGNDRKNHVLCRGAHSFAMLNLYPYSNGHIMVAPNRHTGKFQALTKDELLEMNLLAQACTEVLDRVFRPGGYNIGINAGKPAGAGIPGHIHLHIVPRWYGDTSFMPVIGDTKIIPEAIDRTYDRLEKQFNKIRIGGKG
jgi:ATP adenylyltransferase